MSSCFLTIRRSVFLQFAGLFFLDVIRDKNPNLGSKTLETFRPTFLFVLSVKFVAVITKDETSYFEYLHQGVWIFFRWKKEESNLDEDSLWLLLILALFGLIGEVKLPWQVFLE